MILPKNPAQRPTLRSGPIDRESLRSALIAESMGAHNNRMQRTARAPAADACPLCDKKSLYIGVLHDERTTRATG